MAEARVLVYDIETAPNLGYVWEKWNTNVVDFHEDWYILSVAWKWLGDKATHVMAIPDTGSFVPDDYALVKRLRELFDEADITVTHNGKTFDKPKAQTRMLIHGLAPPSPVREVDTLQVARKEFAFTSNRLKDLCRSLDLDLKADAGGFSTWLGCMQDDPKAWARMKRYNKQDVVVLEQLYLRFLPWIARHPNRAVFTDRPDSCPRCSTDGQMQARGWHPTNAQKRRRYQCTACGGWSLGRQIVKTSNTQVSL